MIDPRHVSALTTEWHSRRTRIVTALVLGAYTIIPCPAGPSPLVESWGVCYSQWDRCRKPDWAWQITVPPYRHQSAMVRP
jgi:hypothetical protein